MVNEPEDGFSATGTLSDPAPEVRKKAASPKVNRKAKTVPTPEESAAAAGADTETVEQAPTDEFSLASPDINDRVPDKSLLRQTFQHTHNNKRYMVVGFAWNAVTDEWNMLMMERNKPNPVVITRPVTDLTSKFEDGSARFRASPDA